MKQSILTVCACCLIFCVLPVLVPPETHADVPRDSSNFLIVKDPHGRFYVVATTNAQYLHVHPGARLDALTKSDVGGRLRGLYLKRYVMNVQVRPGDGCRLLGWRPIEGLLCNDEPVVSYWETTFTDPMR